MAPARAFAARQYALINGKQYAPGDLIDAPETLHHADVLIDSGVIAEATPPPALPDDPSKLKRTELNDLAAQQGVEAPEALPNKDAVIEAIRTPPTEAGTDAASGDD